MEREARYFLVGLLLIVTIGVSIVFVLWTANTPDADRKKIHTIHFMQSVSGLSAGSRVTYLGVPVGKVMSLSLGDQEKGGVLVSIAVDQGTPVNSSTVARLSTSGLTGQSSIELEQAAPMLQDDTDRDAPYDSTSLIIPGTASVISKLAQSAPVIADKAEDVLGRMEVFLSEQNQIATSAMLANMGRASGEFEVAARDMQTLLAEIRQTNKALQQTIPHYDAFAVQLNSKAIPEFRATASDLSTTSKLIASQMRDNSAVFKEFIAESRISMQIIRDQILQTAQKAEQFTEDLRANPSRLIYRQPESGMVLEE
jgi:phospholipid/cholesterol/gamma-HCH transport system substrate-binding protein